MQVIRFLFIILLPFYLSCATVQDCSKYTTGTTQRCSCIRSNGEHERARQCSLELFRQKQQQIRIRCLASCWSNQCEEKCKNDFGPLDNQ